MTPGVPWEPAPTGTGAYPLDYGRRGVFSENRSPGVSTETDPIPRRRDPFYAPPGHRRGGADHLQSDPEEGENPVNTDRTGEIGHLAVFPCVIQTEIKNPAEVFHEGSIQEGLR